MTDLERELITIMEEMARLMSEVRRAALIGNVIGWHAKLESVGAKLHHLRLKAGGYNGGESDAD